MSCFALIIGAVRILFFLVKMAPNVTEKLDYTLVASGQWLVLAVVNSSDCHTDDHNAVLQWLGQRDTENEETL